MKLDLSGLLIEAALLMLMALSLALMLLSFGCRRADPCNVECKHRFGPTALGTMTGPDRCECLQTISGASQRWMPLEVK